MEGGDIVQVPPEVFKAALKYTSRDKTRRVLNGVYVQRRNDGTVRVWATDSLRAFEAVFDPTVGGSCPDFATVLPNEAAKAIASVSRKKLALLEVNDLGAEHKAVVRVAEGRTYIPELRFESETSYLYSAYSYPNVSRLLNDEVAPFDFTGVLYDAKMLSEVFSTLTVALGGSGELSMRSYGNMKPIEVSGKKDGLKVRAILMPLRSSNGGGVE